MTEGGNKATEHRIQNTELHNLDTEQGNQDTELRNSTTERRNLITKQGTKIRASCLQTCCPKREPDYGSE